MTNLGFQLSWSAGLLPWKQAVFCLENTLTVRDERHSGSVMQRQFYLPYQLQ